MSGTHRMRQLLFIPCKPFSQAKTRLDGVLDAAQREQLARKLYQHTLSAVAGSHAGFEAIVISSDADALQTARKAGLGCIVESAPGGLNQALTTALAQFAHERNVRNVGNVGNVRFAYLPTDLPYLSSADLDCLGVQSEDGDNAQCIIAPDFHRQGTNFLSWPAAIDLRMTFGPASFDAHYAQARRLCPSVRLVMSMGLRWDLDLPRDLQREYPFPGPAKKWRETV